MLVKASYILVKASNSCSQSQYSSSFGENIFFFFSIWMFLSSSHSPAVVMPQHSTSYIQTALKNRKQGEAITFSQVWNVSFHESIIFRTLPVSSTDTALGLPKTWIIHSHISEELEPWLSWIWKDLGCGRGLFCRVFVGGSPCLFLQNEWDMTVRELEEVLCRGEEEKAIVLKATLPSKLSQAKPKPHHQPNELWLVTMRNQFVWYHFSSSE